MLKFEHGPTKTKLLLKAGGINNRRTKMHTAEHRLNNEHEMRHRVVPGKWKQKGN